MPLRRTATDEMLSEGRDAMIVWILSRGIAISAAEIGAAHAEVLAVVTDPTGDVWRYDPPPPSAPGDAS